MRLGIKGKQVLGVTSIVGAAVVVLSLLHLSRLARVSIDESVARAELLSHAIFQRARDLVVDDSDPFTYQCYSLHLLVFLGYTWTERGQSPR